jgi:hypothetical protein
MRLLYFLLLSAFILGCEVHSDNQHVSNDHFGNTRNRIPPKSGHIDGVYRFLSETTSITSPEVVRSTLADSEWKGLWFFQDGFFSKTMMKIDRTEWTPKQFPQDAKGTGFDGTAGTYAIRDNEIVMDDDLSFYPGASYARNIFEYRIDGQRLVLTQTLLPSRESASTGVRVIVLEKLREHP